MINSRIFYNDPAMPDENMLELLHSAFREHVDQGIDFGCSHFSIEEYKDETRNAYLFVAYDEERPIGTLTLKVKKKYGFLCYGSQKYGATVNDSKRKGVGSFLEDIIISFSKEKRLLFIVSATATCAKSSVKWHIKNGYIPFCYKRFEKRNYNSIVFILPLIPSIKILLLIFRYPILYASKMFVQFKKR